MATIKNSLERTLTIIEEDFAASSITATKLGTNACSETKLKALAVTAAKFGTGAVTVTKFGASAVTTGKLSFYAAVGVAGGYKVARGNRGVSGTATDTSGLAAIVEIVAINKSKTGTNINYSPVVSAIASGTDLFLSGWKFTAADNTAMVAGTSEATLSWLSVGT